MPRRHTKITFEQAQEIRSRAANGEPRKLLAAEFGIRHEQVCRIVHMQSYVDPTPLPTTEQVHANNSARHKRWRDANREHVRASGRVVANRFRQNHLQEMRAKDRIESVRRYREDPKRMADVKARSVVHGHKRREWSGDGHVTVNQWKDILEVFGGCCAYCGCSGKMTMDHVTALSRGGAHDVSNLVPACGHCNKSKSARGVLSMVNVEYRSAA